MPGSPPINTIDPGTTPPPKTRLSSCSFVATRGVDSDVTSLIFSTFAERPSKLTRLLRSFVSGWIFSSTKVPHSPQLEQRPR